MSYRVGTTHYNLPQTEGTDKRDWSDTNQAFADVDAALYQAEQDAATATSRVGSVDGRVTALEGKMASAEGDIATLQASDTTQDTTLLQHGQAITGLGNRVTALEYKVLEITNSGSQQISTGLDALRAKLESLTDHYMCKLLITYQGGAISHFTFQQVMSDGGFKFGATFIPVSHNNVSVVENIVKTTGSIYGVADISSNSMNYYDQSTMTTWAKLTLYYTE